MRKMIGKAACIAALFSGVAVHAAEPPYVYKGFGFSPTGQMDAALSSQQVKDLNDCKKEAALIAERNSKNASRLSLLYGFDMSAADHFGVAISGCLGDTPQGKGWKTFTLKDQQWQASDTRTAGQAFLGLMPVK